MVLGGDEGGMGVGRKDWTGEGLMELRRDSSDRCAARRLFCCTVVHPAWLKVNPYNNYCTVTSTKSYQLST